MKKFIIISATSFLFMTQAFASLHMAIYENDILKVEQLVMQGADVNEADKDGITPLHIASRYCNDKIAKFLIKNDANILAFTSKGYTSLHVASYFACASVAELIIEKAKEEQNTYLVVNAKDNNWKTPLDIVITAIYNKTVDYQKAIKVVQLLTSNRADLF